MLLGPSTNRLFVWDDDGNKKRLKRITMYKGLPNQETLVDDIFNLLCRHVLALSQLEYVLLSSGSLFSGLGRPMAASAAGGPPTAAELQRIVTGYDQINDLMNNFEQRTTTCRENGGECKRDAEPIRRVLGLRSTTDPLFQIEKVFDRVKYMDSIDPDKLETFFEAAEDWNSAITMSNSMAFISQFGEYNPGGGKDEVLKYLNESQKQVKLAQKALKTIMDCLDLN